MGGTLTADINVCFKNKLRANKDISHLSTLEMQNVSAVIAGGNTAGYLVFIQPLVGEL